MVLWVPFTFKLGKNGFAMHRAEALLGCDAKGRCRCVIEVERVATSDQLVDACAELSLLGCSQAAKGQFSVMASRARRSERVNRKGWGEGHVVRLDMEARKVDERGKGKRAKKGVTYEAKEKPKLCWRKKGEKGGSRSKKRRGA